MTDDSPDPEVMGVETVENVENVELYCPARHSSKVASCPQCNERYVRDGDEQRPGNLHDTAWSTTGIMARVAGAADARGANRTAVLAQVLARAASMVPPSLTIDAVPNGPAASHLQTFVGIVGVSGAGKTLSARPAAELTTVAGAPIAGWVVDQPGSAAGLERLLGPTHRDGSGKETDPADPECVTTYPRVLATWPEGDKLIATMTRAGEPLAATLTNAWDGSEVVGSALKNVLESRQVKPGQFSLGVTIAMQPTVFAALGAHADIGLFQRFLLAPADVDTGPFDPAGWRAPVEVIHGLDMSTVIGPGVRSIGRVDEVTDRLWWWLHHDDARPLSTGLDSQRPRLVHKVAALLSLLHGSTVIDSVCWGLADQVVGASVAFRSMLMAEAERERRLQFARETEGQGRASARVDQIVSETRAERANGLMKARVKTVLREGPLSRGDVSRAISSRHKKDGDFGAVIDALVAAGVVVVRGQSVGPDLLEYVEGGYSYD